MSNREKLQGLYGITAAHLLEDDQRLAEAAEQALSGGMRMLQYRNKSADRSRHIAQARLLKQLCHQYQALLIINDDIDLASHVAADGVHLGGDDASIAAARAILGAKAIVGCSCYNQIELAIRAQQSGADYVAFGRFFASATKPQAVEASSAILAQARSVITVPICAIGGITLENAPALIDQGADMVAVIEDLFGGAGIAQRAQGYQALFA